MGRKQSLQSSGLALNAPRHFSLSLIGRAPILAASGLLEPMAGNWNRWQGTGVGVELFALALLQIKHFLGDFVLQTANQVRNKGTYGHPAGLVHAGTHAALTIPCLLAVGIVPYLAVGAAAIEFVIHYHQDWLKERLNARIAGSQQTKAFWVAFGADQLLHQLFYVSAVLVLL